MSFFHNFRLFSFVKHLTVKSEKSLQQHYSDIVLKLNAVIETATDGIISIDESGKIELVNPAAAQLFGYEISELLGQKINILMPRPDATHHDTYLLNYMQTGKRKIIGIGREVLGKRKDGSVFPMRLSISEVKLHDRRIFTGIVHDLTEQKNIERKLKEEKERTQRYLNVANTVFVVIDKDERVTMLNRKGCEILGLCEEDIVGKNWFETAVAPHNADKAKKRFHQFMNGDENINLEYQEYEVIHSQTLNKRLIAWHNSLIHDDDGKPKEIVSAGVDVTDHRAAEERIIRLNAELEQRVEERTEELATAVNQMLETNKQLKKEIQEREAAEAALRESEQEIRKAWQREKELSEMKSRFVSMASHEFRTPLSTILSSADLIEAYKKEAQQGKRERHTNRIKSAVVNLTNILNDFLSLSRLEEGRIDVNHVEFDLKAFLDETMDEISMLLKAEQTINRHEATEIGEIYLDKKLLKNILFNLISNAIKYSEPGSEIDCRIAVDDAGLHISIADQGIGIPEEEQQHLFTPFFRAHNVENIQGTGLGLNIVKRYIDLLHGEVRFESRTGVGTTFYIDIPLSKPEN